MYIPLTYQTGGEDVSKEISGKVYDLIITTVLYYCYDMETAFWLSTQSKWGQHCLRPSNTQSPHAWPLF